jgi:ATP-dependent Clp protease ATP-binding subunit ClpX
VVRKRLQQRSSMGFVGSDEVASNAQLRLQQQAQGAEHPLPDGAEARQRELKIRRLEKDSREESYYLAQVMPDDLLSYGLIPEFVGRLPVVTSLEALDRNTLVRILVEPKNSVVRQFQRLFAMDGVVLEFTQEALDAISTEAFLRRTGARGLRSIVETALLDVMYEAPSRSDIVRCVVTAEVFTHNTSPQLYDQNGTAITLEPYLRSAA